MVKKDKLLKISLLSASLLVASAPAINANIPAMAKAYSDIPLSMVEMITTIPSMFLMISVLLSSFIAKKFGYKQTIMLGLLTVAICGIIPLFIKNFYIVLASRALFGFGVGLFNSLLVAMITYFYEGDERTSLFGIQSACEGFGGMIITFLAGQLLKINWQAPFCAYFIAIPVVLLFGFFVPKVDVKLVNKKNEHKSSQQEITNEKNNFPIIGFMGLVFVVAILYMIMGIKVSSLMTTEGYASASDASFVIMLLSLGAMISGVLFGKMVKRLNQFTLSVAFFILGIGMILIGISQNVILTVFGGFVIGFGFRMVLPYLFHRINNSHLSNKSLATSLILVSMNCGTFISPYASIFLQSMVGKDSLRHLFYMDGAIFFILSLGIFIISTVFKRSVKQSYIED